MIAAVPPFIADLRLVPEGAWKTDSRVPLHHFLSLDNIGVL